jgi:hypothetical protein
LAAARGEGSDGEVLQQHNDELLLRQSGDDHLQRRSGNKLHWRRRDDELPSATLSDTRTSARHSHLRRREVGDEIVFSLCVCGGGRWEPGRSFAREKWIERISHAVRLKLGLRELRWCSACGERRCFWDSLL